MKLPVSNSCSRAGFLLIECLVYMSVLAIILGIGFAAFYRCLENSKTLRYATDDMAAALRSGERWRADIRGATGKIIVETTPDEQILRIPRGTNVVLYHFSANQIHRNSSLANSFELILQKVKTSRMEKQTRGPVTAWRWEMELSPRRGKTKLRPMFTFEAVSSE